MSRLRLLRDGPVISTIRKVEKDMEYSMNWNFNQSKFLDWISFVYTYCGITTSSSCRCGDVNSYYSLFSAAYNGTVFTTEYQFELRSIVLYHRVNLYEIRLTFRSMLNISRLNATQNSLCLRQTVIFKCDQLWSCDVATT